MCYHHCYGKGTEAGRPVISVGADAFVDKAEHIDLELSNVILVPHKTNSNLTFAIYLLKRNLWKEPKLKNALVTPWREHCEYEALCEGDDYWIDPLKLQKQVEYLDEHPECYLHFHRCIIKYEISNRYNLRIDTASNRTYNSTDLVKDWIVPTQSILMRKEIHDYPIKKRHKFISGDIQLYLTASAMGTVYGSSDVMSVYRINCEASRRILNMREV